MEPPMESGHGVRASVASMPYSQDEELSGGSDQETADGSLYMGSFAATERFGQTASSFAFDDDASASFRASQQRYGDVSRSLEVEESIPEEHLSEDELLQLPHAATANQQQGRRSTKASNIEDASALTAGSLADLARAGSSRHSDAGSVHRSVSRHSSSTHRQRSRVVRASADSLQAAASPDAGSLPARSSTESLPAAAIVNQRGNHDAALLPPRPSSSSPVKRPSSSHRRSRHSHSSSLSPQLSEPQPDQQQHLLKSNSAVAHSRKEGQPAAVVSRSSSGKKLQQSQSTHHRQQQQEQLPQQQKQLSRESGSRRKWAVQPEFEGDLSEWGRTNLEHFYDEDDQSITSSHPTLSSGVSPRDIKPRVKPFDVEAARETLAYNAGLFSRAQVLRRDGTAPAALGIADDLPDRMAYQQLHILAGMAGKVQDAIMHNKRIFEQRIMQQDRALLKKVFQSWRAVRYGSVAKQQKIRRAAARIAHGSLSRAFFAWKEELHLVDKNLAMKRKVAATIARGLLKRTFLAWQRQAQERWWKNQLVMREREVALLEAKIRGYEKRPIQVLQKRRLRGVMDAWYDAAAVRREKRLVVARAGRFWTNQQLGKAWRSWVDHCESAARRRVLTQKVLSRCKQIELAAAWNSWLDIVAEKQAKDVKVAKAAKQWQQSLASRAWRTWQERAAQAKARQRIAMRWMQPAKAQALAGWQDYVAWRKHSQLVVGRALAKMRHGMLANAFYAWMEEVEQSKIDARITTKEGLETTLSKLQAENERLRRDNERFVRLIDSGEWGRGRVAELVTAGEVMKSERDALLKLIGSLRREFEAVAAAKGQQEDELKLLKEKMTIGGAARNRLLVKGGSSFNALVRAMKQDLIDNGTAAKDPALLYEIDKLSMDRVQVYPDGELNVQAIPSGPSPTRAAARGQQSMPATGSPKVRTAGCYSSPTASLARGSLSSTVGSPKVKTSQSPSAAGALHSADSHYTTLSVEAGQGSGSPAPTSGSAALSTQRVLQALSSLSPAQVDQLEAAVKMSTAGPGASNSGLSSTNRRPGV